MRTWAKSKRRLFHKSKKHGETGEVALQITSMADIFTILLVFLLKGLSSDALQITPSNGTHLPQGLNTAVLNEPALQIELSQDSITVEKEFVASLDHFRVGNKLVSKDGMITALQDRLSKERERQKLIAQSNDTVKIDSRAIILSDQSIPFATMKPILRTLSASGYSDVKFAVVKD